MTTADRLTMTLGEAMFTQRAIRRLKPDPIPDDVMRDIMEAAIRAPNTLPARRSRGLRPVLQPGDRHRAGRLVDNFRRHG